jgi:hypothetical protein
MNIIYLMLIGIVFIVFYVAKISVSLTGKHIQAYPIKKPIYIFINSTVYTQNGIMAFVSMVMTAFWYGILSFILESIFL